MAPFQKISKFNFSSMKIKLMLSTQKISKQVVPIPLLQKIFKIHKINYAKLSQLWVTRNRPNFMVETEI